MYQKALIFLQNAWSPMYAPGPWPRHSWLKALWRSRTGQRLERLIDHAPGVDFYPENTTTAVGEDPDSVLPEDPVHIHKVIDTQLPDVIVACGAQSRRALVIMKVFNSVKQPVLCLPHPAFRLVTNALFDFAGQLLLDGLPYQIVELDPKKPEDQYGLMG